MTTGKNERFSVVVAPARRWNGKGNGLHHRVDRVPGVLSSRPNWLPPRPLLHRSECCPSPLGPRG
jgi:hypothetical protein